MDPVRDYVVTIEYKDYEHTYAFKSRATRFIYGNNLRYYV